jgi:hypothetical protein
MRLSTLLLIGSLAALFGTFLLECLKAPDPNKRRWRTTLFLGFVLLCINAGLEVSKRISEGKREEAAKLLESEQRTVNLQLMSDIQSLNSSAAEAFEKLNATVNSLPASIAAKLGEDANRVQTELNAVRQALEHGVPDDSAVARIRSSIEETQAHIRVLDVKIEAQRRLDQTAIPKMSLRPTETQDDSAVPRPNPPMSASRSESGYNPPQDATGTLAPGESRPADSTVFMQPQLTGGVAEESNPEQSHKGCLVEIRSPHSGDSVGPKVTIQGVASIPVGMFLWVAVHKEGLPIWWPQGGGSVKPKNDRSWVIEGFFGDEAGNDSGDFEITALVVDEDGDTALRDYVRTTETNRRYPGTELPVVPARGCSLKPRIVVQRR